MTVRYSQTVSCEAIRLTMMAELGFQANKLSSVSGFRVRDGSPDSVIFTPESNFSLLSSASASVERCSYASDAHDYDSEVSLQLAGRSSGPDPNQNKASTLGNKHSRLSRKEEKAKAAHKEDSDADLEEEEEELQPLDSARSSFSLALRECLDRSSRSEALQRKTDRQRPASLDLNNAAASSPRLGSMKKGLASSRLSGAFPSPGTPNYRHSSVGMKGWSSERVPLHNSGSSRNHLSPASSLPFNNGKALPSKWEDAERWICSPVGGDGGLRPSITQPQRRPKSKSGPLGPPGVAYNSLYSPPMPMYAGGNSGNFIASSPFSAGVISTDALAIHSSSRVGTGSVRTDPCMARSVSVHGCSDMLLHTGSQDENLSGVKDAATDISRTVSRRDMATQMSPDDSLPASPKMRHSISTRHPPVLPTLELQSVSFSESEVRDVQVDERVTMTRWSKKHKTRIPGKGYVDVWRKKDRDGSARYSSAWDITDAAKSISKVKREEAKIAAWENLQKAKAEAAIRKLEMKLEKKRSSSMDKIMNKLRSAQKKAQEMRSSVSENRDQQVTRTSHKAVSLHRTCQMRSLSGCFTCHAF